MLTAALFPLVLALSGDAADPPAPHVPEQPAEPEGSTAGAPEQAAAAWAAGYDAAKALMLAGRFAEAAQRFTELSRTATNRIDRTLAVENAAICREWTERRMVLAPASASPPAAGRPAPTDRRTLDELAMLYTEAVVYGLGSGVVLDSFIEPESPASAILPVLALGGLAAGGVALLDHNVQLRYGVAQSIVSGLSIGLQEGLCWMIWNQARVPVSEELSGRTIAATIWGTATAGAIIGGVVGTMYGTTPGRAALMSSAALWSGLVGGMTMGAVTSSNEHSMLAAALALNVGAVTGGLLGAAASPSIARVRFLDLGGFAGGVLFSGLYLAAAGDGGGSAEGALAVTSLGVAVGLGTSWALTRNMQEDLGPAHEQTTATSARLIPLLTPASHGGMLAGVGAVY